MSQKSQRSPTEEKEESKEKHTDEATEKETRPKSTLQVPKPGNGEKGSADKDDEEEKKDDEEHKEGEDERIMGIVESVKGEEEEPEELQVLEEVPVIIYRPDVEYKPPPKPKNLGLPFKVKWLNDCYQQTLLPDAPWHMVKFIIFK